jgi:hypothetical protein
MEDEKFNEKFKNGNDILVENELFSLIHRGAAVLNSALLFDVPLPVSVLGVSVLLLQNGIKQNVPLQYGNVEDELKQNVPLQNGKVEDELRYSENDEDNDGSAALVEEFDRTEELSEE